MNKNIIHHFICFDSQSLCTESFKNIFSKERLNESFSAFIFLDVRDIEIQINQLLKQHDVIIKNHAADVSKNCGSHLHLNVMPLNKSLQL